MKAFEPRIFEALIDEYGLDDGGVASFTFKVQSLTKGKFYEERNPASIEGHKSGVVIDDNSCWWHYGTEAFKKRFKEVKCSHPEDYRGFTEYPNTYYCEKCQQNYTIKEKEFSNYDWDCFHDALFDATGKDYNKEELKDIYIRIPLELKFLAKEWGMNDTGFREGVIEWYKKNFCCPKCSSEMAVKSDMFFWRGKYLSGLVCEKCNILCDNPKDSFIKHIKSCAK